VVPEVSGRSHEREASLPGGTNRLNLEANCLAARPGRRSVVISYGLKRYRAFKRCRLEVLGFWTSHRDRHEGDAHRVWLHFECVAGEGRESKPKEIA